MAESKESEISFYDNRKPKSVAFIMLQVKGLHLVVEPEGLLI